MSSLFSEYCKRHRISFILPMPEGLLFLQKNDKPAAIVLVSSFSKGTQACPSCRRNTDRLTVEVLTPYSFPTMFHVYDHGHVDAEENLLDYLSKCKSIKFAEMSPYVSSGERDNERWLWEYFLNLQELSGGYMNTLVRNIKASRSKTWLDEMFYMTCNYTDYFNIFYNNLYSALMINRIYLLKS